MVQTESILKQNLQTRKVLLTIPAVVAMILFIFTFSSNYVQGGIPWASWIQTRRSDMDPIIGMIGVITMVRFYIRESRTRETHHGFITSTLALATLAIATIWMLVSGKYTAAPIFTDLYAIFFTRSNAVLTSLFAVGMVTTYIYIMRIKKGRAGLISSILIVSFVLSTFANTNLGFAIGVPAMRTFSNWLVSWLWTPLSGRFGGSTSGTMQVMVMFVLLTRIFTFKESTIRRR